MSRIKFFCLLDDKETFKKIKKQNPIDQDDDDDDDFQKVSIVFVWKKNVFIK